MGRLRRIRLKDWARIVFALFTTAGVYLGLSLLAANIILAAVGAMLFCAALLATRPYLYLRHLVAPRWNRLPQDGWDNYFFED